MGGDNKKSSWEFLIYLGRDSNVFFTNIEAYAGMAERLVRDSEIGEALRDEIKDKLEHNNQLYVN